jgi:peptidoglycan/LPS O-acetylase OafA/YrhL
MVFRKDIEGLRGWAVVLVILFHLGIDSFAGGFVGVDVFFVISGFLITRILINELNTHQRINWKYFLIKRFNRIFPALLVTLTITACVAWYFLGPSHLEDFNKTLQSSLFGVSNIYFFASTNYFDFESNMKPLLHTWSLGIEEQFYLFWPFFLWYFHKINKVLSGMSLLFLSSILLNFFFIFYLQGFPNLKEFLFFCPFFRVYEFLCGGIIAVIPSAKKFNYIWFTLGLCLISISVICFNESMLYPGKWGLLPAMGTACLIYSNNQSFLSRAILENRVIRFIGKLSYSLYLTHWPIISFLYILDVGLSVIHKIIICISSVFLSWLMYLYIEEPCRRIQFNVFSKKVFVPITGFYIIFLTLSFYINPLDKKYSIYSESQEIELRFHGDPAQYHKNYYGGICHEFVPNNTHKPDVILIGDSHGKHYLYGLYHKVMKDGKLNLHDLAGLSFFHLPNLIRFDRPSYGPQANKAMERLKKICSTSKPIVILSQAWRTQTNLHVKINNDGKIIKKPIDGDDVIESLHKFIEYYDCKKLIIIGQVPSGKERNLVNKLTLRGSVDTYTWQDIKAMEFRKEEKAINEKLSGFADEYNNVHFIDPFEALTIDGKGRNFDDSLEFIYSDGAHLSRFGSLYIVDYFEEKFKHLIYPSLRVIK